jgi:hypothetical protein
MGRQGGEEKEGYMLNTETEGMGRGESVGVQGDEKTGKQVGKGKKGGGRDRGK